MTRRSAESGFSLIELLVATGIFLIITGIVASALKQITQSQTTIWNRTQMHSGVRGATELMQQEVGQAGRMAIPPLWIDQTNADIVGQNTIGALCDSSNPGVNATTIKVNTGGIPLKGLYATGGTLPASYVLVTTMDGANRETVPVWSINTSVTPPTITGCFNSDHKVSVPGQPVSLVVLGGFANGIVPPTGVPNGSTANVLKMFGDINGDATSPTGQMVYVEYTCDTTVTHKLYRNVMAIDTPPAAKPPLSDALVLLSNVMPHPDGSTGCFTYQIVPDPAHIPPDPQIIVQGQPVTFVLDVAITLTVQTQQKDPITGQNQTETKALLNVSPRNVFNAWQLAGAGFSDHLQSTPATVTALLAVP